MSRTSSKHCIICIDNSLQKHQHTKEFVYFLGDNMSQTKLVFFIAFFNICLLKGSEQKQQELFTENTMRNFDTMPEVSRKYSGDFELVETPKSTQGAQPVDRLRERPKDRQPKAQKDSHQGVRKKQHNMHPHPLPATSQTQRQQEPSVREQLRNMHGHYGIGDRPLLPHETSAMIQQHGVFGAFLMS